MTIKGFLACSVILPFVLVACANRPAREDHDPGMDRLLDGAGGSGTRSIDPDSLNVVRAAGSFLDDFLVRTADSISKRPGTVAVFPALSSIPNAPPNVDDLKVNGLGDLLMKKTASGLTARGVTSILAGPGLKHDLLARGIQPGDWRRTVDIYSFAGEIEVDYVVFGTVEHKVFNRLSGHEELRIDWRCERSADREVVARYRETLPRVRAVELLKLYESPSDWLSADDVSGRDLRTRREIERARTVNRDRLLTKRSVVRWTDHPAPRPRRGSALVKVGQAGVPIAEAVTTEAVVKGSRVVIGVPATPPATDTGKVFRTAGYFNRTEQVLEFGLTRRGLKIVDRVVFEAELRKVAAANGAKPPPHIRDAGELFGLAKDSELSADFLLQMNAFDVAVGDNIVIDVRGQDSYQKLALEFPGADLPRSVELPGQYAHLNAKLVNIKTGTIDWNVDCRADVRHAVDGNTEFEITVSETTADTRKPSRQDLTADLAATDAAFTRARADLTRAYDSGRRERIAAAEANFDRLDQTHRRLAAAAMSYTPQWTATHLVRVVPPPNLVTRAGAADEALERKLTEVATGALLDSMDIVERANTAAAPEVNRNAKIAERLQAEIGLDHLNRALWYADEFYHTVIDKPDLDLVDFPPLERPNARFPELLLQEARRHYLQYLSRRDVLPRYVWQEVRSYAFPFVNPTPEKWFEVEDPNAKKEINVRYEFKMKDGKVELYREVRSSRGNVMERSRMFTGDAKTGAVARWDGREHALIESTDPGERTQVDEPYRSIVRAGKGAEALFEFIRRGNY
jgi:hypothetical protein